ncbi:MULTISPECIES: phospho-N-acetylmuramoyl-pentapeptide-transferase [unclassified Fusibacter]|uniref:phospho-N-acetylmuramoyl-pentapeptide- transferase n=1 Tax=unclassified Fusibacter TaxID=2624464 RepID=UPI001FA97CB9|nr:MULTISPECIES: phospho-N-acetylmuramoyl-pentapeptide-transferase [unclassified Fusibacter]MCK8061320.1 phospho-N-acetylmuramoyl-pentapeptide-transferase [Fusibacter sp. A2]
MTQLFSLLLGLTITVALGPVWIPFFKKLKFGQYIREDGPQGHLKKAGTPTFGGIMFVFSALVGSLILGIVNKSVLMVIVATVGYGLIGFADDYIKVIKKDNLGLRAWQKMLGLSIVTVGLFALFLTEHTVVFPGGIFGFYSPVAVFIFFAFIAVATTNAVNLTDGIDGLCASVTLIVTILFSVLAYQSGQTLLLGFDLLMAGALMGYLVYNWHPAKVFMGDTGSLALGGYVLANAVLLKIEWFIPVFGLIYVLETLSVIIQVAYFKKTKKRFFKMAPLHHHFELIGWREKKIVFVAGAITSALCVLTYYVVMLLG